MTLKWHFDSRICSNICINFLRIENSTFLPKDKKEKKKEGSLKDISTYGNSIQSPTLSTIHSWILIFHRINPFFPVSILEDDSIELEHHDAIIIFAHLNIPRKRVGETLVPPDAPLDHNDSRKKKENGVMKENSAQRDLLTFIVSKRSKWRH